MRSGNHIPTGEVPHFPDEDPNPTRTAFVVAVVVVGAVILHALGVGGSEASSQTDQPPVTHEIPDAIDQ